MVRTANLPGGTYSNHYSYNDKFTTSYKEGGPVFTADMVTHDYDLKETDDEVQSDIYNGVNRLYGKSTIKTVAQVLYDLVDVTSNNEDEDFYVSESLVNTNQFTDRALRKTNFGIIYAEMMKSKSQTLSDLLQYLQAKYAVNSNDSKNFKQILNINGLSSSGEFTLDANGNQLSN